MKTPLVSAKHFCALLVAYSDLLHSPCSGAALYEIDLQRELAMREAQALQEFLLQQAERLQRLQLEHWQPEVQVHTFCLLDIVPRNCLVPLAQCTLVWC
jgi:hypothetical protein